MTTEIIIRCAKDIQQANEIANFSRRYGISSYNLSAISWEVPCITRRNYGVQLLKAMIARLTDSKHMVLFVMIEMSAKQPKSAVVKYKKTWGLLRNEGLRLDAISNKQDFLLDVGDGFVLSGVANVEADDQETLEILLNRDDYVYFTLLSQDLSVPIFEEWVGRKSWLDFVESHNGIVLFPMGYADDNSCEIVAVGHEKYISPLL